MSNLTETTTEKSNLTLAFEQVENLKLITGTYDVSVSSKNISHFKSKTNNLEYWIALEPESKYEA